MPHPTKAAAIIVAAGRGTRMGGLDKCALLLNGRSLVSYSVDAFAALVDTVIVVVAPDRVAAWKKIALEEGWLSRARIVAGGETRQDSVCAGLAALTHGAAEVIAIHDGARPLIEGEVIRRCLAQGDATGAAITAVPVTDTIKRVEGGIVAATLDRVTLWAAQTPQVFHVDVLSGAFLWAESHGLPPFTDEAGLAEAFGHPVAIVRGDRSNIKVTEPIDQIVAEALLAARKGAVHG